MTAAVRTRPDTSDMVVVHRVFRRELRLLPLMVRAVTAGDTARAARVATHATEMCTALHHHHTGEDELVWPKLHERAALHEGLVSRMEEQHEVVAAGLEEVERLLPSWAATADGTTRDALAAALEDVSRALAEHLDEEERHVLPLVEEHLTAEEYAQLGERGMKAIPKNRLLVFFGHVLEEADPAERAMMLAHVPLPGRIAYRLLGQRKFEKECGELRAGLQLPTQRASTD